MSGYTVGTNNRVTEDPNYLYEFDDEGNLTRRENKSTGYYETYDWDHRNRLTTVTFYDDEDNVLKVVEHSYDPLNRWVRRSVDADGPGGNDAVDTFFAGYDGINPTLQFDGDSASDLSHRYLWGEVVDQIFADEDVSSLSTPGDLLWPMLDHLGSARDLAQHNTGTGVTSIANHRVYNAFGSLTSETNSSIDLIFGFTAKPLDDSTGLQNNLFRWYSSDVGWWLIEDPLSFGAGDTNLRRYVWNSPSTFIDPSGLAPPGQWWNDDWTDWFNGYAWSASIGDGIAEAIGTTYYGVSNLEKEFERAANDRLHFNDAVSHGLRNDVQTHGQNSRLPQGTAHVVTSLARGNYEFTGAVAGGSFVRGASAAVPTFADEMVGGGARVVRQGAQSIDNAATQVPRTLYDDAADTARNASRQAFNRMDDHGGSHYATRPSAASTGFAGLNPAWRQSAPDSQVLARNLGIQPGSGLDAHHIVAGGHRRAAPGQSILDHFQIDINAAENGVPLVGGGGAPQDMLPRHHRGGGLHSYDGIDAVNNRLTAARATQLFNPDGVWRWEGRRSRWGIFSLNAGERGACGRWSAA